MLYRLPKIIYMHKIFYIGSEDLELATLGTLSATGIRIALSEEATARIRASRAYLDQKLKTPGQLLYGINTGFGALCDIQVSSEQIKTLQYNLLRSHACGLGDEVPLPIVRLMLALKIQNIALGYSGVREQVVNRLVLFYNEDILPLVFQQGSLGASGDLAPLAHLSLPLIGEGEVLYKGMRQPTIGVLNQLGISPLALEAKEGLALLNGTQFSAAYSVWVIQEAERLLRLANLCAALSIDSFDCRPEPFDDRIHQIRPHRGQIAIASAIRTLLEGSSLIQGQR